MSGPNGNEARKSRKYEIIIFVNATGDDDRRFRAQRSSPTHPVGVEVENPITLLVSPVRPSRDETERDETHLHAERKTNATIVLSPAVGVLVRVGPQQIAQQALVGDVGGPHYPPDLLHGLQVGTHAAVAAEDLLVD